MAATPAPGRVGRAGGRPGGGALARFATETKPSILSTEFYVYIAVVVGILIAGASIDAPAGGADRFGGDKVWLYVAIVTAGYLISRGLAKSGSHYPYWGGMPERGERDPADRLP